MNAYAMPVMALSVDEVLDKARFGRIAQFIEARSGIQMPASKKNLVEGRLRRRAAELGFASLAAYCDHVLAPEGLPDEGEHLINAITTNKTDFFREPNHFTFLTSTALPQLALSGVSRLRVWSAACSNGAEPYTLAMLLAEYTANTPTMNFGILATDIDTAVLDTARRGIYPSGMVSPVPPVLRQKYLVKSRDSARNEVRIIAPLRASVGFAQLNLMDERYPVGDRMHVIFCRNVLIYFDRPTQEKVVGRLLERLHPGGFLFLGHSETTIVQDHDVASVGSSVFQKGMNA